MNDRNFFDAIRGGDIPRITQLLEAEPALLSARDENGLGPYTVARYARQDAAARLLLERGAPLDICAAAMAGAGDRVAELLSNNRALASTYSHDGWTPLHLAAFFGNRACAQTLLTSGADVHARSRNAMQNTPLHAAAAGRHNEMIALLLAHGADVNAQQQGGWTALHAAAENGNAEMAKLLLTHGAVNDSRADNNQTPLDLAMTRGHRAVAELLEPADAGAQGA